MMNSSDTNPIEALVRQFWTAMETNDFDKASLLLSPDFEYFMPQTGEYLAGRAAFAALNAAFPAAGIWRFAVRSVVASEDEAVSDVMVTDGERRDRAITFHSIKNGLIRRQIEYWPDPYAAPEWRRNWTELRPDFEF
jgi:ketosteroid isomerase-like protein